MKFFDRKIAVIIIFYMFPIECMFQEVFLHPTGISPEDDVVMEGYLFKRATNAFKTWHRRWFQIKDNKLVKFEEIWEMQRFEQYIITKMRSSTSFRKCSFRNFF